MTHSLPTPADFAHTLIEMAKHLSAENPHEAARQAIRDSFNSDQVDGILTPQRDEFYMATIAAIDQAALDETYQAARAAGAVLSEPRSVYDLPIARWAYNADAADRVAEMRSMGDYR